MALGEPQARPADAVQQPDGLWQRPITRYSPDGTPYQTSRVVCEYCWEPMPNYVQAPQGWVSPESASKLRPVTVEGKAGIEAVPMLACYECYKAAFLRFHVAGSELPKSIDATVA